MSSNQCLILFTKPGRPGRVKTRLIGALSAEQAAELHWAFLGDVADRLRGGKFELRLAWALAEGEPIPSTKVDPKGELTHVAQEGRDLGERMFEALRAAAQDYDFVGVVGSDHPELELTTAERAFQHLEDGAEVAIGPAADGGYYLLALRREALHEDLFHDIEWSTETVFDETMARCADLGLQVETLIVGDDVDRPDDLRRLAARLRQNRAPACVRTRRLLAAWGWLDLPKDGP